MYHGFLIHLFTVGHLGYFQHLAIVNCAAVNIGMQMFFCIGDSGFLGYNPRSRIAGSKGSSIFSFLRKFCAVVTVTAPVCIPTNNVLGFPFLHNFSSTWFLLINSIMISEISQVVKDKYHIISSISGTYSAKQASKIQPNTLK